MNDGFDQRARGVILAAVASGVTHVLDLFLVQGAHLVLLGARPEAQFIDQVDGFAQVISALQFVLDLAENLADLVFDGVRAFGTVLEIAQIGEQFAVDEIGQVIAGQGLVVIQLSMPIFWGSPHFPTKFRGDDRRVGFACQCGCILPVFFEVIQVLQE